MVYPSLIASTFACFLALANADYVKFNAKKLRGSWAQNADTEKYPIYAYYEANSEEAINGTASGVYSDKIYYAIDLSFGSDAQNITVLVDTVSSDLWINSVDNDVCAEGSGASNLTVGYAYTYSASSSSAKKSSAANTSASTKPVKTYYTTSYDSASDIYVVTGIVSTETTTTKVTTTNAGVTKSHDAQFYPSASSKTNYASAYPHPTYSVDAFDVLEYEPQNCSSWGLFDSDSSESFITEKEPFESYSTDFTPVEGIWAKDFVLYGDALLSNVSFGLVSDSDSDSFGVLGLGLPSFESTWLSEGETYDGFLANLKSQGFIEKSVYALYDNYLSEGSSLLFGGIDLGAFEGNLSVLPLIEVPVAYNDTRNASAIAITLSSIYFDDNYKGANYTELLASGLSAAIIDTSLSTAILPYYIYDTIVAAAGFKYSTNLEAFVSNTSHLTNKTVVFDFQGVEIDIPVIDLTFPLVDIETEEVSDFVVFAAGASPNATFVLGDAILQYLYVAIDLDDLEVAIAPKNFSPESEDIVEIIDSFPNATSAASYNYTYGYHGVTDLKLAAVYNPNSVSKTSFSLSYVASATGYSTVSETAKTVVTSARPSATTTKKSTSSSSSKKSTKSTSTTSK